MLFKLSGSMSAPFIEASWYQAVYSPLNHFMPAITLQKTRFIRFKMRNYTKRYTAKDMFPCLLVHSSPVTRETSVLVLLRERVQSRDRV